MVEGMNWIGVLLPILILAVVVFILNNSNKQS